MEVATISTEETQKLAEQIASRLCPGDIVLLEGELGAGKTTFVRFLVQFLGFSNRVQSPTFVLARQYINNEPSAFIKVINHLDLYRLSSAQELEDLGLTEIFCQPDAITIIEWPSIAKDLLPANVIEIKIEVLGETERKFYVQNLR
ncbi:tRNA (adenosine(37)-N6)-threonylcarbamoyltransferase complex ATPase subunit type 1 TsaE [candidate division WWE3 bacterium]|uniref:tRNA threonylcarbamoyladenosine biosynthesis protein TsaE n=1 Tax=candidate division WWE3 bacterium TaxID=2053526 RepID=A0A7X9HH34_UNCKA|nr:tRNA (adenosine(37)-N6)-threonylcarbamoyltransferase complex ATPase subunit type 1 TsaE [candidate division WWE3 bacterium]